MPEVAQERPVILLQRVPPPLALGVVGLGHIDGDHPVGVPGQDGGRVRRVGVGIGEELERQAPLRVLGLARQGEVQAEQTIDQPALGRLQLRPALADTRPAQVGNDPSHPARQAIWVRVVVGDGPVADVLLAVIRTEPVRPPFRPRRERPPPLLPVRFERAHVLPVGEVRQRVPAVHARGVLEEHELITMPAMENLHRPISPREKRLLK